MLVTLRSTTYLSFVVAIVDDVVLALRSTVGATQLEPGELVTLGVHVPMQTATARAAFSATVWFVQSLGPLQPQSGVSPKW